MINSAAPPVEELALYAGEIRQHLFALPSGYAAGGGATPSLTISQIQGDSTPPVITVDSTASAGVTATLATAAATVGGQYLVGLLIDAAAAPQRVARRWRLTVAPALQADPSGVESGGISLQLPGGVVALLADHQGQVVGVTEGSPAKLAFIDRATTTIVELSPFLPAPDDTARALPQRYWGWVETPDSGSWLIHRRIDPSIETLAATAADNPQVADYAQAWGARSALNYN